MNTLCWGSSSLEPKSTLCGDPIWNSPLRINLSFIPSWLVISGCLSGITHHQTRRSPINSATRNRGPQFRAWLHRRGHRTGCVWPASTGRVGTFAGLAPATGDACGPFLRSASTPNLPEASTGFAAGSGELDATIGAFVFEGDGDSPDP